jgi:pilus assembly protein Flp/PilA
MQPTDSCFAVEHRLGWMRGARGCHTPHRWFRPFSSNGLLGNTGSPFHALVALRGGWEESVGCARVIAQRLWRDQRGAALIEYVLLIGLITLAVLGAVIAAGTWAHGMWVNFLSGLGP